jgi:hypothetical protein
MWQTQEITDAGFVQSALSSRCTMLVYGHIAQVSYLDIELAPLGQVHRPRHQCETRF